ncbi:MAG: glycosyltransferase family 39 protein [Myxococcales bacterium]|nr:glycosyltransferase family 39 protein [Myxococcales bacterium]
MSVPSEPAAAHVVSPRRRPLGFELMLVVLISAAVMVPGIWRYSLVDPWETHYGEVARMMLQNNDWVHTEWPQDNEGFRSKPVLQFWMMAAGMRAVGVGEDGGYSGEMVDSARVMIGIRLPFILSAIAGLTLLWWMLACLVSRRLAWLSLLTVGSAPMFAMIARNAMPDMPMVACTIGAMALFTMAVEDGERPILPFYRLRFRRREFALDARHVVLGLACGFILIQAAYYAFYFLMSPQLAVRGRMPSPALWLPLIMVLGVGAMSRHGFLILRLPFVLFGGAVSAILNEPVPLRAPRPPARGMFGLASRLFGWVKDGTLEAWDKHALDRYLVRGLMVFPGWLFRWIGGVSNNTLGATWEASGVLAEQMFVMKPLTTLRQVYLIGCYALLGVSVLAKGPPGLAVVGIVGALHVIILGRWRGLYEGAFELKRGVIMMLATFLPWHVAMFLKDGLRFIDEYLFTHVLNRAAVGVDNSPGTFEYYTDQIGHGMWLWAALLPAALACAFLRARQDTREGRVRFMVALWAICGVAMFCLVQTKFHHYILPAIPPLAILVAFLLDDLWSKRYTLHPLLAGLGVGIVLMICRDLMHEPERWIEMFVFRYDRPWPNGEPWSIDPSDGIFALGIGAALVLPLLATRFVRAGVIAVGAAGLAICVWALQVYMPLAGQHWGMRDAIRTYYEQRTIYGEKLVYFGAHQLYSDWSDVKDTWSFETFIPDTLQAGQPITLEIEVHKAEDERILESEVTLFGTATGIGDHTVTVTLAPGERAKLDALVAKGEPRGPKPARPPVRAVDADRLIAWQLYWRGENFWSGDEIWGWPTEMKTAFMKTDNVEFNKYINDRVRAPLGRRYFVVTEGGRITGMRSMIPTQRGRDSFEVLDTTSNKFSLAGFTL